MTAMVVMSLAVYVVGVEASQIAGLSALLGELDALALYLTSILQAVAAGEPRVARALGDDLGDLQEQLLAAQSNVDWEAAGAVPGVMDRVRAGVAQVGTLQQEVGTWLSSVQSAQAPERNRDIIRRLSKLLPSDFDISVDLLLLVGLNAVEEAWEAEHGQRDGPLSPAHTPVGYISLVAEGN